MKRLIIYLAGLFIMAFGVSASIISNLGVSPIDTIPYVTSEILKIDMGICTTAIFTCYVLLQMLLLGRQFPKRNILQIAVSAVSGGFISITNRLAAAVLPEASGYGIQLFYVVLSMALLGFGIFLYVETDIMSLPAEGVAQALAIRTKRPMSTTKIFFDWSVVAVSAVLSICFLKEFRGIREGTLIAAFGVGLFIKLYTRCFQKPLQRFLGKEIRGGQPEPEISQPD